MRRLGEHQSYRRLVVRVVDGHQETMERLYSLGDLVHDQFHQAQKSILAALAGLSEDGYELEARLGRGAGQGLPSKVRHSGAPCRGEKEREVRERPRSESNVLTLDRSRHIAYNEDRTKRESERRGRCKAKPPMRAGRALSPSGW